MKQLSNATLKTTQEMSCEMTPGCTWTGTAFSVTMAPMPRSQNAWGMMLFVGRYDELLKMQWLNGVIVVDWSSYMGYSNWFVEDGAYLFLELFNVQ